MEPLRCLRRSARIFWGWLALANVIIAAEPATPVEHFFAEPDVRSMQLSPDGKLLAFLTTLGTGKVGIALMHLDTGKVEPLVAADDENIDYFIWKGPDHIVYFGDLGGNESHAYRSISISKRHVTALAESYRERYSDRANWAILIDELPHDPRHMLIYGPKEIGGNVASLYVLDVVNGNRRPAPINENKIAISETDYVVDCAGIIRARRRFEGDKSVYEVRREPTSSWTKVAEFPANDPQWSFVDFAADNDTLYVLTRDQTDTTRLHSLSCRTLQLSAPLFHSPEGDITGLIFSRDHTKLYGVAYETDRPRFHWFDADHAKLRAQIDATLPATFNSIVSRSDDEQLLVIHSWSDRDPGTYYLLDRRQPRLMMLGKVNRYIVPARMQPMEPIQFTARDGLVLHGYLTRGAGTNGAPAPLIVHPHGGPYGPRDSWGFDPDVQFLASRGYSVLQINYRGSGGYGHSFEVAGKREWGGKMQDDLTDGVKWAIEQKIADPTRIAIYGGSYGGYAALAGATFTPDLYKCAINYVGVSDLNLITSWGRGRYDRSSDQFYREWVGDDKQYKFERSPVNFVERIKIPTLHAYGFNDPRVEIENWRRLEPKLKQFGKTYEAVIEQGEGHGFRNEKARFEFYRRMEAFLAKYL